MRFLAHVSKNMEFIRKIMGGFDCRHGFMIVDHRGTGKSSIFHDVLWEYGDLAMDLILDTGDNHVSA